jgi:glycosidase
MRYSKSVLINLIIISAMLFGCSQKSSNKIEDIIANINLTADKPLSIVINDLLFTENYNLEFSPNKDVVVQYLKGSDTLILKADKNFEGMTLVEFKLDDNVYQIPVTSKKEKFYTFSFKPEKEYKTISLFGSFNGWDRYSLPMNDQNKDGVYETQTSLEPGVYQYKFFGDGEEIVDPQNPVKVSNGMGSFNSVRVIEEDKNAKIFLHVDKYESIEDSVMFSFIAELNDRSDLQYNQVFVLLNNNKVESDFIHIKGSRIIITLPKDELDKKDLLRVTFSDNGIVSNTQHVFLFDGKPGDNNNFTWHDGIIYSLMIDRFKDGETKINKPVVHDSLSPKANYMGGDLQGVIDKLEDGYFDSLGINTIWISPVNDNPDEAFREFPEPHRYYSGYHGYWPISSNKVEDQFGNMEKLKELVSTAHSHNIKILLDFVSNHTHINHPYFKEHRNWYGVLELPNGELNLRKWDEYRLTTWFEPYLPSFDYLGSQEAVDTVTSNAVWWLEKTGADGYRHDAVKHVPNLFWRTLANKIKKNVSPKRQIPVYQIGETFGSYGLISSYVNNGQLNAQFNFNLYDVALPTFLDENASFDNLNKEMLKTFSVYGNQHLMGNIMDSHDKNRFMAFADGDLDVSEWSAVETGWNNPPKVDNPENYKKLILYMAYMNTIPGLPVIYYGSEFGMTGASDPDNRRMMRFDGQLNAGEINTLEHVKKIINIRKQHTALRTGDFFVLQADQNIYSYLRSDMNERLLVVLNKSNKIQETTLKIPFSYDVKKLVSLKDGAEVKVNSNEVKIALGSKDWQIYKLN